MPQRYMINTHRVNYELKKNSEHQSVIYKSSVIEKFRGKLITAGRLRRSIVEMAVRASYVIAGGLPMNQLK